MSDRPGLRINIDARRAMEWWILEASAVALVNTMASSPGLPQKNVPYYVWQLHPRINET